MKDESDEDCKNLLLYACCHYRRGGGCRDADHRLGFVKSFEVPDGGTAVISWLKNGDTDYLMVVNRDPNDDRWEATNCAVHGADF